MGIVITTTKRIENEYTRRNKARSAREHETILELQKVEAEKKELSFQLFDVSTKYHHLLEVIEIKKESK